MSTPAVTITAERAIQACGVVHEDRPVRWPAGRWTEEEMEALRLTPLLTVIEHGPAEGGGAALPDLDEAQIRVLAVMTPEQIAAAAVAPAAPTAETMLADLPLVLGDATPENIDMIVSGLADHSILGPRLKAKLIPPPETPTDAAPDAGLEPGEATPDRPRDWPPERRLEAIVEAIRGLDLDAGINTTKSGVPTVEAIDNLLGWDITGAERDAAWELFHKRTAPADAKD